MNLPAVETIHPDERCYGLSEVNRLRPMPDGSTQWRRVQVVYVARDGKLAEYVSDLGNAFLWEQVPEQAIYASGEESVGMVRDEAERGRHDDYGAKLREEVRQSSTLIQDFLQEKDENWRRIKNQSQFGPGYKKQRNGFPNALRRK